MTGYIVRKPTEEDVEYLIDHARPEDIAELDALDGSTGREALEETPNLLDNSFVWEVDGKVVCIFGVNPRPGPMAVGIIWLLATDEFNKYTRKFTRYCKEVFKKITSGYMYLFNYIHCENKVSIEWLKWLGFTISDPIPVGHKGANFHKFELKHV